MRLPNWMLLPSLSIEGLTTDPETQTIYAVVKGAVLLERNGVALGAALHASAAYQLLRSHGRRLCNRWEQQHSVPAL